MPIDYEQLGNLEDSEEASENIGLPPMVALGERSVPGVPEGAEPF